MTSRDAESLLRLVGEPSAEPVDRAEPGYARIASAIRHLIIANELRPGTWLRLQALAARFGVSMQPVREALHILHGEGLVELQPNRGAQVRGLDRNRLIHVYEIRAGIASIMARRFAEEASGSEIRALERFQAEHDAAIDARDFAEASRVNKALHDLIYARGGNQEALALVHRYRDLSGSVRARIGYSDAHWARVRQEHHALLDAIRRHDGAAAGDIGARHVLNLLDDVLQALDSAGAELSRTAQAG